MTYLTVLYDMLADFAMALEVVAFLPIFPQVFACIVFVIALGSCFAGLKLYRLYSSVLIFFLSVYSIHLLLGSVVDKGTLVTVFSLLGLLCSVMIYFRKKVSAILICIFCTATFVAAIPHHAGLSLLLLCGMAVGTWRYTNAFVIIINAVWGSGLLVLSYIQLTSLHIQPHLVLALTAGMSVLGILIQILTDKKLLAYRKTRIKAKKSTAAAENETAVALPPCSILVEDSEQSRENHHPVAG